MGGGRSRRREGESEEKKRTLVENLGVRDAADLHRLQLIDGLSARHTLADVHREVLTLMSRPGE